MLTFPTCKINLGLHVVHKRQDGYHDIETVFYPVNWCDALEILEAKNAAEPFTWSQSGIPIAGKREDNLIYKAWKLISEQKKMPPIAVHLHKNIPMGAGLGGGSADAAYFITALNTRFNLQMDDRMKAEIASQLGSDCAFFINNTPVFAEEKGDKFSPVEVDLSGYYILLVYPGLHSNTREAYEGLIPHLPVLDLRQVLRQPISTWKQQLINDFETSILKKYPDIKLLKENLYATGAVYASLSGSGSSVFGIFQDLPEISLPASYSSYLQKPQTKILQV